MADITPLLVDHKTACQLLGNISLRHLQRMVQANEIPYVKFGPKTIRFPYQALVKWVQERINNEEPQGYGHRPQERTPYTASKARTASIAPFGRPLTPTEAGNALDALRGANRPKATRKRKTTD